MSGGPEVVETKCLRCGAAASVTQEARLDGDLPDVILDGLDVYHCAACGESVVIRRLPSLHAALQDALLRKPGRLTGRELRFLRERMGWSEDDAARHLHAGADRIHRWEADEEPVPPAIDSVLRLLLAGTKDIPLLVDQIVAVSDRVAPLRARATRTATGWVVTPEPDPSDEPEEPRPRIA